jgi:putative nucleotidyltransferase with HDIG domain
MAGTASLTEKPLTIEGLLAGAPELAALPQVVMRVIDLTAKPNATAADLERVICLDQALAAKILTLANSSYYGLPRRLSSVKEAVVFLGFKSVRNLAMAITTFSIFLGKSDSVSLARRALWRHSLDVAECARVVSSRLPAHVQGAFGTDEAFTCGLLHDIGKMLLDTSRHDLFVGISGWADSQKRRYYEVETAVLPFGHSLIGAAMAGRWNLPPMLCEAVAFHHTPRAAEVNPRLTATISLSNEIAHFLDSGGVDEADLMTRAEESLVPLHVNADTLPALAAACRIELDKGLSGLSFG